MFNPPTTSALNETSVVQLGVYDNRKILLTADLGPGGLMEAARYAYPLRYVPSNANFECVQYSAGQRSRG